MRVVFAEQQAVERFERQDDKERADQQKFLRRLATEYVIMGKDCEHEHLIDAAIANYEKALKICPEHTEAKRRLKALKK